MKPLGYRPVATNSTLLLCPQQMKAVRESMAFPDMSSLGGAGGGGGQEVRIDASFFVKPDTNAQSPPPPPPQPAKAPPPPRAPKPDKPVAFDARKADLSSYQFPVVDDDGGESATPMSDEQKRTSAFKKEGAGKKKSPAFQEK